MLFRSPAKKLGAPVALCKIPQERRPLWSRRCFHSIWEARNRCSIDIGAPQEQRAPCFERAATMPSESYQVVDRHRVLKFDGPHKIVSTKSGPSTHATSR